MKQRRRHIIPLILSVLNLLCACTGTLEPEVCGGLSIEFAPAEPATRAFTATTSAARFKCSALRTNGSLFFSNIITGVNGSRSTTGYYWPEGESLSFYGVYPGSVAMIVDATSAVLTVGSASVPFPGNQDIIAMKKTDVAYGTTPIPVVFDHILAGIDDIYLNLEDDRSGCDYHIKDVRLDVPIMGIYSITADLWAVPDMSRSVSLGSWYGEDDARIDTEFSCTVIPSACVLTVEYDVYGGEDLSYVRSAEFTLRQGVRSIVNVRVPSGKGDLGVTVSVKPWEEEHYIDETI